MEHTDKTTKSNLQRCARYCDEKGQMFAVDSDCNEIRRSNTKCECMCYMIPRSDNGAVTCEIEENSHWDLYRFLDGTYKTIRSTEPQIMAWYVFTAISTNKKRY